MSTSSDEPEGWREPIVEALWRPDLLLGVPPFSNLHWLVWAIACVFVMSFKPLILGGLVQLALVRLTTAEPEWPAVVRDFLKTPDDVDV